MSSTSLKIRRGLVPALCLALGLLIVIAGVGVTRMDALQQSIRDISSAADLKVSLASEMRLSLDDRITSLSNVVLFDESSQTQVQAGRIRVEAKRYDAAELKLSGVLMALGSRDDERRMLGEITEKSVAAGPLIEKTLALRSQGRNMEATELMGGDLRMVQQKWQSAIDAMLTYEKKQRSELTAAAYRSYFFARNLTVALIVVAFLSAIAILVGIARDVSKDDNVAAIEPQTVADGNVTSQIKPETAGEAMETAKTRMSTKAARHLALVSPRR